MLICDLIQGRPNRWASLYDPSRIRAGAAAAFIKENLNVAVQYGSWLTPGEVASVDEITPNTGAVIREGPTKTAVFRDEAGELHRHSAACTSAASSGGTQPRPRGIAPAMAPGSTRTAGSSTDPQAKTWRTEKVESVSQLSQLS